MPQPDPFYPDQFEFVFPVDSSKPDGVAAWRAEWLRKSEALCRKLAMPLNRMVEVRLSQGPILRGRLCLAEEQLWPDGDRDRVLLRIDQTTFCLAEIDSVLRLDDPER